MLAILNILLEFIGLCACAAILLRRLLNRIEYWTIAKFDTFLILMTAIGFAFAALLKMFLPGSSSFTIYASGLLSFVTIFECLRLFYFQQSSPQIQQKDDAETQIYFKDGIAKFVEVSPNLYEHAKIHLSAK